MFISTKWVAAPLLAAGSFLFGGDVSTAEAGDFSFGRRGISISIGGGGHHGYHSGHHGYHGGHHGGYHSSHYGHSYRVPAYRSYYGHGYRPGYYHDTSHYDYHPTEIRRHGNHWDVIPGHYDYHRTGHWHH